MPSADDLSFDSATAVHPHADGHTYDTDIHPLWTVGDKPNGGYLLALLAPGWLGIRLSAHLVAAGMADETCTMWDSSGRVVAQATQLARLRFPDEVS